MPSDHSGGSKPLPPPVAGLKKHDERRDAVAAEYQRQLSSIDLDALDDLDADDEPTQVGPAPSPPPREPSATRRPNLEPVADDAHPPQNRRIPTQPPSEFDLLLERPIPPPTQAESTADPGAAAKLGTPPPASKATLRPSPAPLRRGLFASDRITNMLACAAVGLLLSIYPAMKLAESYETTEVAPRLTDLETAVTHTLAVDAGLVESPEAIAAEIHAGRKQVRRRFVMIWLLAGLPIGFALGFVPRPGD